MQMSALKNKFNGQSFFIQSEPKPNWFDEQAKACITTCGGSVADGVTETLSYLLACGRGSAELIKQAGRLNKKGADIKLLDQEQFVELMDHCK